VPLSNTALAVWTDGSAKARHQSESDLRQTDLSGIGHDPEVACQSKFEPTAEGCTADNSHTGDLELADLFQEPVGVAGMGGDVLFEDV
jgi:hypothetical protein